MCRCPSLQPRVVERVASHRPGCLARGGLLYPLPQGRTPCPGAGSSVPRASGNLRGKHKLMIPGLTNMLLFPQRGGGRLAEGDSHKRTHRARPSPQPALHACARGQKSCACMCLRACMTACAVHVWGGRWSPLSASVWSWAPSLGSPTCQRVATGPTRGGWHPSGPWGASVIAAEP